ncbi:multidrug efflux pump subunit AcrB [Bradyrhizobium japonicum]
MNLGRLSINQPILAMVLSIVLLIVGALAYTTLPVSEYPQVVPPTVVVTTQYPGASAQTVSDTVAAPIEQEINGVEDMLYLYSQATSNGQLTITVTFKLGTDLDKAQVLVQNRVAIAQPRLPEEVQRNGVTTRKNSPDILMVVFMLSPDDTFDQLYISNYALLQVRDQLLRLDGVGDIQIFGARDYSMRLWLDPDRIANLGLTSTEVIAAIRAQNIQIAGGQVAEPPITRPRLPAEPRLHRTAEGSETVRGYPDQGRLGRPNRAPARCRPHRARCALLLHQQLPVAQIGGRHAGDAAARVERAGDREKHLRHHGQAEGEFSEGPRLQYRLQSDRVHRAVRP